MNTTQLTTATSGTITCQNTQQDLIVIHEAGASLSITLSLPDNQKDGQKVTLISVGGITAILITAVVGTILNALTGIVAGNPATYMYYKTTDKWYRIR